MITVSDDKLLQIMKNNIKDELYWLLNIKIKWNREAKTISLSQEVYIDKILK
jgi:hypothetical protein